MCLEELTKEELLKEFDLANDNYFIVTEHKSLYLLRGNPNYIRVKMRLDKIIVELKRRRGK